MIIFNDCVPYNISVGDEIKPYGIITKITPLYIVFGDKKFKHKTVSEKMVGVCYEKSPDIKIDWRNEVEVDEYYEKFQKWSAVIRMGDIGKCELFQVKNNKIFHKGEYYLPYYSDYTSDSKKKYLKDCNIFGYCAKIFNSFWGLQKGEITVNLFYIEEIIDDEVISYNEKKLNNKRTLSTLEYMKSLDFNRLTSYDLNLIKQDYVLLFDKTIFPYTYKNVKFDIGDWNRISVKHRNREGYINMDNSYYGSRPFGINYGLIVECLTYFTNECRYVSRVEDKKIKFDTSMLDLIAEEVIKKWDLAIENNASLYHSW
jgi:hypothetical protein